MVWDVLPCSIVASIHCAMREIAKLASSSSVSPVQNRSSAPSKESWFLCAHRRRYTLIGSRKGVGGERSPAARSSYATYQLHSASLRVCRPHVIAQETGRSGCTASSEARSLTVRRVSGCAVHDRNTQVPPCDLWIATRGTTSGTGGVDGDKHLVPPVGFFRSLR